MALAEALGTLAGRHFFSSKRRTAKKVLRKKTEGLISKDSADEASAGVADFASAVGGSRTSTNIDI